MFSFRHSLSSISSFSSWRWSSGLLCFHCLWREACRWDKDADEEAPHKSKDWKLCLLRSLTSSRLSGRGRRRRGREHHLFLGQSVLVLLGVLHHLSHEVQLLLQKLTAGLSRLQLANQFCSHTNHWTSQIQDGPGIRDPTWAPVRSATFLPGDVSLCRAVRKLLLHGAGALIAVGSLGELHDVPLSLLPLQFQALDLLLEGLESSDDSCGIHDTTLLVFKEQTETTAAKLFYICYQILLKSLVCMCKSWRIMIFFDYDRRRMKKVELFLDLYYLPLLPASGVVRSWFMWLG